jgi:formate dehydrogenase maturation protein FdhE
MMALPEGALPLLLGTGLALGALALVLSPLIGTAVSNDGSNMPPAPNEAEKQLPTTAVEVLREIEFDRETGKLSDADYADLKQRYTRQALAELRAADAPSSAPALSTASEAAAAFDPVEAAIQRAREHVKSCGVCGPRPEPDAIYCSSCGRYLPEKCGACGTSVDLVGSRFCSGCGSQLAAA